MQTLPPGDHHRSLIVDQRLREYLVHIPKSAPATSPPLVLAFHGGGSCNLAMEFFSGLSIKSDEAGFIVVYPNGTGSLARVLSFNGGNCCGYAQKNNINEPRFVSKLLDDLARVVPYDAGRVFATGMSNGAVVTYLLASELADRFAAIAPVAGPMGTETCSPSRPVPVCHFHGDDDDYAPFGGGIGEKSSSRANFYSVQHTIDAWVRANGCNPTPLTETLPTTVEDGTSITRTTYSQGKQNSEVILYTIHGGGHTWPGRQPRLAQLGKCTENLSASDVMWEFFQKHSQTQG